MSAQQSFDFDIETPADTPFPVMQTPENGGKCSRCLRVLKGRYSRCAGAGRVEGWYAWCDDCAERKRAA